jgi:hypothetical protein
MQKQLAVRPVDGGPPRILAPDEKGFDAWPSDWSRDGAVLFTRVGLGQAFDVWMQPTAGGAPRPYLTGPFREFGARVSRRRALGGVHVERVGPRRGVRGVLPHPRAQDARLGAAAACRRCGAATGGSSTTGARTSWWRWPSPEEPGGALVVGGRSTLFRAPYLEGVHANYDVSPDGTRFAVVSGRRWSNRMIVVLRAAGRR